MIPISMGIIVILAMAISAKTHWPMGYVWITSFALVGLGMSAIAIIRRGLVHH